MTRPLLTTKLHIPALRASLVPRPHLTVRLDEALRSRRRLILLSAPAGFGKTTLLAEWIAGLLAGDSPLVKVAWITLDEGDNDPVRFSAYLAAALRRTDERIGQAVGQADELAGSFLQESHLVQLINQVAALPQACVLVLDDYHLVTSQVVHDAITFLVDHASENLHLVLATRGDPPLPLPRLRARGHLSELRQSDLRFTAEEAAVFLNNVMGLGLSPEDVAALEARTEGWITGLQMAALSLQGQGRDPSGEARSEFIRAFTGSHRFILDYLGEEVLEQQPPALQDFLLKTSILQRLSGPLCDAVLGIGETGRLVDWETGDRVDRDTGRLEQDQSTKLPIYQSPSSQSILEHLDAANLFIVSLDHERRWYRYHRLFADLLRQRLGRSQPEGLPVLHLRASEWYEQNGLAAEAIGHALSAGDFQRAARLIEQAAEATLMRSEIATLLRWVDALPAELVPDRPLLCIYHAWALLFGGRPLDAVEARLRAVGKDDDLIAGRAAPLRALVAFLQGQLPGAAELSRQALEQLPADDVFLRGFAGWLLGISRMVDGDIAGARQMWEEIARKSQEAGNVMLAVMVLCSLAELHMRQGQLHEAAAVYEQALALAVDDQGRPLPVAGEALMGLGELAREWNDLEAAVRYLNAGIERSRTWGEIWAIDGYISLAYVRQAQGSADGAQEALRRAWQLALRFDATEMDDKLAAAHQADLWVRQGYLAAAERWVEDLGLAVDASLDELAERARGVSLRSHWRRTAEYVTFVRVLMAKERYEEALALLELLVAIAGRWGLNERVIKFQVLRALALQARGDTGQALDALAQALSLAEPGGYVRVFLDEGEPMIDLLRRAGSQGMDPAYVAKLLAAFGGPEPLELKAEPTYTHAQPLIEPLSERELDVLRLLATGLSNPEIANELVVAVSTVRSHCKSIYGKLNVHGRWDAVRRAEELGLI